MITATPAGVFVERHVQAPVQSVFDFPMTTNGVRQPCRVGRQRADEIALFHRYILLRLTHGFDHDYALQASPFPEHITVWASQRDATPRLAASVPGLFSGVPPIGKLLPVTPFRHVEKP